MYKISTQQKKLVSISVKAVVVILTFGYLYYKLFVQKDFSELKKGFNFAYQSHKIPLLLTVVALMFLNWALETYKWQQLMQKLEVVPFKQAFKAIFAGVTVSFFTPNRVGEFMGRIIFLYKANKLKAILGTIMGSFAQLTCTIFFGTLGFAWFVANYKDTMDELSFVSPAVVALIAVISLVLYFKVSLLHRLLQALKIKKVARYTAVLTRYKTKDLAQVLIISALRYIVFTTQYIMVLYFFDIDISIPAAWCAISIIFMVQASIPSVAFSEIGNRGAAALAILSVILGANELSVISAAYSLWAINIVIPSLIGLVFILQAKLYPKA